MTVSSGFFNSVNHDRLYDAEQLSSIFDGIIIDGVYENVGEAFNVIAYPDEYNTVLVGTGRAWFDHTWTLNDSRFSITLDPPNEMLGRIDAIVIDVNKERDTRKNSIIYLKGDEATPDFPPTLIDTENHHQYPIAYITRHAEQNGPIKQSDIEITVGTGACPIVTGVLEAQNLENLMQQLDSEFNEWWDGIKEVLDENVATNLQNQINEINAKLDSDTALVGLLEKPIAEAFMSGDYGLNVSSYTVPLVSSEQVLFDTVSFLPNGEVVSVGITPIANNITNRQVTVNIVDTNGINTSQNVAIPYDYMSSASNVYDTACAWALIRSDIGSYPAKFDYIISVFSEYTRNVVSRFMYIQLSSSKTLSVTYSDPITTSVTSTSGVWDNDRNLIFSQPTNVIDNDGSTIIPIYFSGSWTKSQKLNQERYALVYSVSSDLIMQGNKLTILDTTYRSSYDEKNFYVYHKVGDKIISYNTNASNADVGDRLIIDPETLDAELVFGQASIYPAPSTNDYTVLYGAEAYSMSETNGVSKTYYEVGDSPEQKTIKRSQYFLGASNLMEPLPEGTLLAAQDSDGRLYGIASTGEQLAIGLNGGTAILKSKKTVSESIDLANVVLWLKGFYVSDSFTGYLLRSGTNTSVYNYDHSGTSGSMNTASVVKISKEV